MVNNNSKVLQFSGFPSGQDLYPCLSDSSSPSQLVKPSIEGTRIARLTVVFPQTVRFSSHLTLWLSNYPANEFRPSCFRD